MVLNVAATLPFWPDVPSLTDVTVAGYLLLAVLWAGLGVALGQLLRGVPGALVVILVTPMIVEQLIFRLSYAPALDWLTPAVKFLPFTAGLQLVSAAGEASGGTADEVGLLSRWPSGAVFAVFVADHPGRRRHPVPPPGRLTSSGRRRFCDRPTVVAMNFEARSTEGARMDTPISRRRILAAGAGAVAGLSLPAPSRWPARRPRRVHAQRDGARRR